MDQRAGVVGTDGTGTGEARVHLAFLDGLRGVAALFVTFHHMWLAIFGMSAQRGIKGLLTNGMLYGHLAVDVFIVLSGFCLSIPVARSQSLRDGAVAFFKKRARRILPPFYASLVICVVLRVALHVFNVPGHFLFSAKDLILNALLLQDLSSDANYVFNPPFWTVAVEWKIYFLLPVLLFVLRRYGLLSMLGASIVGAAGAAAVLFVARPTMALNHTCPWYLFLFALGVAGGVLSFAPTKVRVGRGTWEIPVAAATLGALLFAFPITDRGEDPLFASHLLYIDVAAGAFCALCLMKLTQHLHAGRASLPLRVLSWQPLVKLGTFGYSLYLVHSPVLGLINDALFGTSMRAAAKILVIFGLGTPLILLLSYAFFLLFERPLLIRKTVPATSASAIST